MRELLFMPIEPIEERYSAQWLDWFETAFIDAGKRFEAFGSTKVVAIEDGEFLDSSYTMRYKLQQAHEVCEYIDKNRSKPFTVFCLDFWNPCLLNIAYMRDTLGLDIEIKSMLHAGVYDPHDFLAKSNVAKWGCDLEDALYGVHDEIFIATNFHVDLWKKTHRKTDKFTIVDWPVVVPMLEKTWEEKEDIVVFPHRLADEKSPEKFKTMADSYSRLYPEDKVQFVLTKEICKDKFDYYEVLRNSKIAVSYAEQETFGIAMQEAVNYGCIPIVPDRLSYSELFERSFKYSDEAAVPSMIHSFLHSPVMQPRGFGPVVNWVDKI